MQLACVRPRCRSRTALRGPTHQLAVHMHIIIIMVKLHVNAARYGTVLGIFFSTTALHTEGFALAFHILAVTVTIRIYLYTILIYHLCFILLHTTGADDSDIFRMTTVMVPHSVMITTL